MQNASYDDPRLMRPRTHACKTYSMILIETTPLFVNHEVKRSSIVGSQIKLNDFLLSYSSNWCWFIRTFSRIRKHLLTLMLTFVDCHQGVVTQQRFNQVRSDNSHFGGSSQLARFCTLWIGGTSSYRKVSPIISFTPFLLLLSLFLIDLVMVWLLLSPGDSPSFMSNMIILQHL